MVRNEQRQHFRRVLRVPLPVGRTGGDPIPNRSIPHPESLFPNRESRIPRPESIRARIPTADRAGCRYASRGLPMKAAAVGFAAIFTAVATAGPVHAQSFGIGG